MKIEIIKKSNGIHPYLSITISDFQGEDLETVKYLSEIVDKYNKEATETA